MRIVLALYRQAAQARARTHSKKHLLISDERIRVLKTPCFPVCYNDSITALLPRSDDDYCHRIRMVFVVWAYVRSEQILKILNLLMKQRIVHNFSCALHRPTRKTLHFPSGFPFEIKTVSRPQENRTNDMRQYEATG